MGEEEGIVLEIRLCAIASSVASDGGTSEWDEADVTPLDRVLVRDKNESRFFFGDIDCFIPCGLDVVVDDDDGDNGRARGAPMVPQVLEQVTLDLLEEQVFTDDTSFNME